MIDTLFVSENVDVPEMLMIFEVHDEFYDIAFNGDRPHDIESKLFGVIEDSPWESDFSIKNHGEVVHRISKYSQEDVVKFNDFFKVKQKK